MFERIKKSLTLKWLIFSILLATIPLAIAGFSIIQIYQENLKKSIIEIEKEKASMVVERTLAFFEKVTTNLLSLADDDDFRRSGFSQDHIRRLLESFLYRNEYMVELTFLNEKGQETVKISKYKLFGQADLRSESKSEMFGKASNGKTYYGEFYLTSDIVPTMVIAVPIEEYKGEPVGVLSAKIHLRYLWNLLPQTQIGKRGSTYVVDQEGNLIAHPDTRQVLLGLNVKDRPMVKQAIDGKEGNLEFEHPEGGRYLAVYKPIKELGWGVIVQVPIEEAYAPLRRVANTAFKWFLVALTFAIIFSLFLTKRLTRPIKRLSAQMARVSQGNLDVHIVPTTKDDEIGVLTESFNQMIRDLKRSQEILKEAEEKYRKIFEGSKDMVFITTFDGKLIEINQAGVEILGYNSKEELMEINVKDIYLDPDGRQRFQNEIVLKGFIKDFEIVLKRKDGTPVDCLITATARKDAEDRIIGYHGIIKDISARKKMEEDLSQTAGELQTLHDLSVLINQTLDLEKVLPIALEKALSLTGFEMGAIHLLNEDEEILELKFDSGQPPTLTQNVKTFKVGEGVAGKVVQLKRPIILSVNQYPTPRVIPFLKEEGIQTLMSIPLLAKEKAIGTITLLSRSSHGLTQREVNLLESIGNQIGLALENAKLFSNVVKAKSEWETTFDAVTDLITIRDKDHRVLRANKAAFRRFGLKPEQMIGKKCFETLHHSDQPCDGCYISETLRTKKPTSGERASHYLNGVFRYHTFPVYDEAGEIIAVADLAREITEEKRFEMEKEVVNDINRILASSLDVRQVMKAVHSELKRVLSSERLTIVLFDETGGFEYFVLEKEQEAGELVARVIYPKKGTPFEKVADTGLPLIIPDTAKSDSWIDQKVAKEGILSGLIFPLKYKGRIIGTMNFGSKDPNHFSENQYNFLQSVAPGLAISIENARLLDQMKASEEKYRTVVESAMDGVGVIGDDYRFRYANKKLAEISGYSREELVGMDFRNLPEEGSKRLVADRYMRRQRNEDVPPRYEFNIVRKDGEIRNVEISSSIVKDSEGSVNTISIVKDVTEKKKMEEQLFQAEKLRAIGEMASGVAHDFNNALAVILGNTQLLLYTAKDEELRETLQTIEKVSKDAAQTVRRLQDFTRKKVHQELFKLDVNSIVKDAMEMTKPKWKDEVQGRGIHIEMVSNLKEVPPVKGNASELREVISNIIFNAIEAMPEGGKIAIRTFCRKENVYVQISDTGIGMTEEVRKKVFEPFFTTKPFSNTGLGLSMSYGIIKRFGGEIDVESSIGRGATFTLSFPAGAEGQEEVIPSPFPAEDERRAKILVIDDEESVRIVLWRILCQANHQVTVAENGEEGIRLFGEKEFDIVLTDLGMPGMSGWEVCRAIKKMSPSTPVGMITGWGTGVGQDKIKEYDLDFLISKPFDFGQILSALDETIQSKGNKQFGA